VVDVRNVLCMRMQRSWDGALCRRHGMHEGKGISFGTGFPLPSLFIPHRFKTGVGSLLTGPPCTSCPSFTTILLGLTTDFVPLLTGPRTSFFSSTALLFGRGNFKALSLRQVCDDVFTSTSVEGGACERRLTVREPEPPVVVRSPFSNGWTFVSITGIFMALRFGPPDLRLSN